MTTPIQPPPPATGLSTLEVSGLSKRFGTTVAVDDVSFDVRRGEIFGFCGRNGAGKTTTMRMSLGLLAPDSGSSTVLGRLLEDDVAHGVGYVPAERGVYVRMTVRAQLRYFAELHGVGRAEANTMVEEWAHRLNIAQHLDDSIETLSSGNKQRVQLATALVHDPLLLVLDEPFAGLDPVATSVMSKVLGEVAASGVGVLFSSHQLDLVEKIADRVGIIDAGKMVAIGTLDELRAANPQRFRVAMTGETEASAVYTLLRDVDVVDAASMNGPVVEVEIARAADPSLVLDAARVAGSVVEFRSVERSLEELYIELVGRSATRAATEDEAGER